jgi:predicted glycosyltransferase
MTREAALLGIPTVSVFAGRRPRVDEWLEERGLLARLSAADQLARVERRPNEPRPVNDLRERGQTLVDAFVDAVASAG